MVQSNGHGEYKPSKEYRYLDADVWIDKDAETGDEKVTYTEDVLKDISNEPDSDPESEDDTNSENQN